MSPHYWKLYLSCLLPYLSSVSIGMALFYPSAGFTDINSGHYGFNLTADVTSWLASFAGLFALPGTIVMAPIMDRYGRKFALMVGTLPFAIGWLLNVAASNVATLATARAILGFTIGMEITVILVYLSEISPKHMRGTLGSMFSISICIGGFLITVVGTFANWRWMALTGLAIVALASLQAFFLHETPRWLLSKGHREEAAEVMKHLWDIKEPNAIAKEMSDIETHINVTSAMSFRAALIQLLQAPLWKPFAITQLLMMAQQFSGNAYVLNYTVAIFQSAGKNLQITNAILTQPKYQSCLVTFAYVIGGAASTFFIDRLGRRILLISSASVITLSMAALGVYYYLQLTHIYVVNEYLYWLPLNCLLLYVLGFSFAYGGVPFVLVSELFPMQVRGVANALGSFNHNLCYFLVLKIFPTLKVVPDYGIFWIYASVAFISLGFVYFFVPETKGRSLEEIQMFWSSHSRHKISENKENTTI